VLVNEVTVSRVKILIATLVYYGRVTAHGGSPRAFTQQNGIDRASSNSTATVHIIPIVCPLDSEELNTAMPLVCCLGPLGKKISSKTNRCALLSFDIGKLQDAAHRRKCFRCKRCLHLIVHGLTVRMLNIIFL
jgi:hypothetical protein